MAEIRMPGGRLDLPSSFSIEIEETNPIFNERGSQSLPATVPPTSRNRRLFAFPDLLTSAADPNGPALRAEVVDGVFYRSGIVNVTSAGRKEGISFNIGFDNSTAYAAWQSKKLSELSTLPVIKGGNFVSRLLDLARRAYEGTETEYPEIAVFPVAVACEKSSDEGAERAYWEVLNVPASDGSFNQPSTVKRLVDGKVTEVKIPDGYGVSPFLKVWKLLELAFADLGVSLVSNPFRDDPDLERLVVLNNTADGISAGAIRYSELVPDCTVAELMKALWVRFGLVYRVDSDKAQAELRFVRDIITDSAGADLTDLATETELVTFPERGYVRLSAGTSIEGAEPPCERFEDFAGDLTDREILQGFDIEKWFDVGAETIDKGRWMEPPEIRENREIIGCEISTGKWFRLDTENRLIRKSGSSFFCWDPRPEGLEPMELESPDECVPVVKACTVVTNEGAVMTGNRFDDYCPGYMVGSRHRHSIIKGSTTTDSDADTEEETPLAFMFAYTFGGRTVGRVSPEGIVLDSGSQPPRLTLLFQFEDGLFANFWKEYDEFLRHGGRVAEFPAMIPKTALMNTNLLRPILYRGVRCLIDTISYSLPSRSKLSADFKLRVLQTQGNYDIREEQAIPPYALSGGVLEWVEVKSEYDDVPFDRDIFFTNVARDAEIAHGEDGPVRDEGTGVWSFFDAEGCEIVERSMITGWKSDSGLPAPSFDLLAIRRIYKVAITVNVYRVTTYGAYKPADKSLWEFSPQPWFTRTYEREYAVELAAKWLRGTSFDRG